MREQRSSQSVIPTEQLVLGAAVRELRARNAISQEELGFRAGLHRNYVGAIERGEINPTFRTLLRLTGGLDVRLSALVLRYEDERATPPAEHRAASRATKASGER
ncbi:MAG: transcriptional regulator, family [Conexibacter sp.]|nr:transcriptional regulator, family [Conexibacter sp.]